MLFLVINFIFIKETVLGVIQRFTILSPRSNLLLFCLTDVRRQVLFKVFWFACIDTTFENIMLMLFCIPEGDCIESSIYGHYPSLSSVKAVDRFAHANEDSVVDGFFFLLFFAINS